MKIGIDASRANSSQKTGVEWYAFFVIQELKKIIPSEHQVELYTREPLQGDLANLPSNWQARVLNWPPRRLWTQIRLSWEMWRRSPEVLFSPAHFLPLIYPTRSVITVHDCGGLRFPAGYTWLERVYTRWSLARAMLQAVILTPSRFSQEEIVYLFKKEQPRVLAIPNAFDKEKFFPITDAGRLDQVKQKYNLRRPFFLSISRLEEKKNTAGIVRAFEMFRERQGGDYDLALLGKPGYGFSKVRAVINASKYKNDIILPGWVDTEDVPVLMSLATAFVFPSFYEGFGIPIIEAMACGLPVIASNTASCPEVSGEAALLINPQRPGEIAIAMVEIVNSSKLTESLRQAGLKRAGEFSWRHTAEQVWTVLQSPPTVVQ